MRKLIRKLILKEFTRNINSNTLDLADQLEDSTSSDNVIELWCTRSYFYFEEMGEPKLGFVWFRDKQSMLNEVMLQDFAIRGTSAMPQINRVNSLTKRNIDPSNPKDLEIIKRNFSHPPNHEVTIVIYDHTDKESGFPSVYVPNSKDYSVTLGYFYKENADVIRI